MTQLSAADNLIYHQEGYFTEQPQYEDAVADLGVDADQDKRFQLKCEAGND